MTIKRSVRKQTILISKCEKIYSNLEKNNKNKYSLNSFDGLLDIDKVRVSKFRDKPQ